MTRYLALGLALLALSVGAWGAWQRDARLRDQLARERAKVEAMQEAAEVHRAAIRRLSAIEADYNALLREIANLEGSDDPLAPAIAGAARRVWAD